MRVLRLCGAVLGLVILCVPGVNPGVARAEPLRQSADQSGAVSGEESCIGLDLVLLVDHSGSMSGYKGQPTSDPNNVRIESVKFIIDQLFINRLTFCPHVIHRVAVVGFGGTTQLQLPPTAIDVDPESTAQAWQQRRDQILQSIEPLNLLNTDFIQAFDAARDVLASPGMGPVHDDVPRKRAIVVLTDGNPCVGSQCSISSSQGFDEVGYMQTKLVPKLNDPRGAFPPWQPATYDSTRNVYIWLVAINNAPLYLEAQKGTKTVGDLWREITEQHGGAVYSLGQHAKDIPSTYVTILDRLLGSTLKAGGFEKIECGQPIYVDAYVQKVFFHILKDRADVPVAIQYPDDETVISRGKAVDGPPALVEDDSSLITSYQSFGPIERYALNRPPAGEWLIQTQCDAVEIYRQTQLAQVDVLAPVSALPVIEAPPFYDKANPTYLRARLRGTDNQPFVEDARFPLRLTATVTEPDGTVLEPFELKRQGDGIYSSAVTDKPLPQAKVGPYRVRLRVTARHADPKNSQELVLYDKARNTYTVKAVQWFDFNIISPRAGDHFDLVQYRDQTTTAVPLEVAVQLVDKEGNPIGPEGILPSAPAGTFVAQLTTPANRVEEVPLAPDPRSAGQFRGRLRTAADALSDPPGLYRVRVEMKGQYQADTYSPRRLQAEVRSIGVEQFDFRIVTPVPGQTFNLVHYLADGPAPEPLEVAVQLTSGDGAPLAPNGVLANPKQGAFVANLTTPDGRMESVPLELDPVAVGLYRASLRGGSDALADRAGDYRVRVDFNGQPDTDLYAPRRLMAEVLTSGAEVTPVGFQVATTDGTTSVASQPLSQGNPACVGAELLPIRAAITLFDTRHPDQAIDPAQVADGDPNRLFSAELVDPASNTEAMPLSVQIGDEGLRLVGLGGTANPVPGPYIVRVVPNPAQFRGNFQLTSADAVQTKLAREDVLVNRPSTCRAGVSGLIGVSGLALIFLVWNVTSRPMGTLSFLHSKTQVVLHEEIMGRPLRGWWHTYRSKARNLAAVELSQVKVTRSKGSSNAINLELFDRTGNLVSRETGLASGDRFDLDAQVVVRYD
jgi:hypothetical protein